MYLVIYSLSVMFVHIWNMNLLLSCVEIEPSSKQNIFLFLSVTKLVLKGRLLLKTCITKCNTSVKINSKILHISVHYITIWIISSHVYCEINSTFLTIFVVLLLFCILTILGSDQSFQFLVFHSQNLVIS